MMDPVVFDTLLLALESEAVPMPERGPILVLNAELGSCDHHRVHLTLD